MKRSKIQLMEKEVTSAGQTVRLSDDLDKDFKKLKGIAILSFKETKDIFRSCTLAGREVFPKGFEVAFLQSNGAVAPNDRFFKLDEIADGKEFEMEFQDGSDPATVFERYTLKIYLLLEND